MWYKAFHDVNDRLYIIDLDESNSIYIDFTFASDASVTNWISYTIEISVLCNIIFNIET